VQSKNYEVPSPHHVEVTNRLGSIPSISELCNEETVPHNPTERGRTNWSEWFNFHRIGMKDKFMKTAR